MNVKYQIGENCELTVDVKGFKEVFQVMATADSLFGVKRCGNCESPHLKFMYRTPQGYEYYSIQCRECKHELKFGERREDHALYPKGWEPPFDGDNEKRKPKRAETVPPDDEEDDGGIPW